MWTPEFGEGRPLEATWLVVTPPCPDVRLGQGLCGAGGSLSEAPSGIYCL